MKVLVTGASGMLGQDILKTFADAGHQVIGTDRGELDITKREAVEQAVEALRPDLIINTAAYNLVDKVEDPAVYPLAYAVNVDGPRNLAEVAAARGIALVHYSTDYVFAGDKPEGYREDDRPSPISKYGETKFLGEMAVQRAGGKWYLIRTSKIFGRPGLTELSKPSFVALMLKLAVEKPELQIVDEEVGCPTYTKDLAEFTLRLINEDRPSGIYHGVNDGPAVTWYQFAEEIFKIAGVITPRQPVSAETFGVRPAARPKFAPLLNTKMPSLRPRLEALKEFLALPKISLVIVSWNVRDILRDNLKTLFTINCRYPFEVVVIDNGSTDGSAKMIREEFPQVHLIHNDYNSGFAHANNQGLKVAQGEVLILYNPDMKMNSGVLEHVFETLNSRPEIGVMGVQLRSEDGTLVHSVRRDPGFKDQLAILLKLPHLFPKVVKNYLAADIDQRQSQEVEQIRGSFFAFRRDVMQRVGLLDEKNFFVWFEEVDWCKRVRAAGLKIWFSAEVFCTDLVGRAFAQQSIALKQSRFSRSMANYFRKWHPAWQAMVIISLRPLAMFAGFVHDLVSKR